MQNPPPSQAPASVLYVMEGHRRLVIDPADILYITADHVYADVWVEDRDRQVTVRSSLTALLEELPANFIRVHRGHIVNTDRVSAWSYRSVRIKEKDIPVGRSYSRDVLQYFKRLNRT